MDINQRFSEFNVYKTQLNTLLKTEIFFPSELPESDSTRSKMWGEYIFLTSFTVNFDAGDLQTIVCEKWC